MQYLLTEASVDEKYVAGLPSVDINGDLRNSVIRAGRLRAVSLWSTEQGQQG